VRDRERASAVARGLNRLREPRLDRGLARVVVEEDRSFGEPDAGARGGLAGDRRGRGPGVHEEQTARLQHLEDHLQPREVLRETGPHVVVRAGRAGDPVEECLGALAQLVLVHRGRQEHRMRHQVRLDRLHREVHEDLPAERSKKPRDVRRGGCIRQDRERQRDRDLEERGRLRDGIAEVIHQDREDRTVAARGGGPERAAVRDGRDGSRAMRGRRDRGASGDQARDERGPSDAGRGPARAVRAARRLKPGSSWRGVAVHHRAHRAK